MASTFALTVSPHWMELDRAHELIFLLPLTRLPPPLLSDDLCIIWQEKQSLPLHGFTSLPLKPVNLSSVASVTS